MAPQEKINYSVRLARRNELGSLPAIETSAGQLFKSIPELASLAEDDPSSESELEEMMHKGQDLAHIGAGIWVVLRPLPDSSSEGNGELSSSPAAFPWQIVGFLAAKIMDDNFLYIAEMSVAQDYQGKGAGGLLLDTIVNLANSSSISSNSANTKYDITLKGVSLTTYPDVTFNGQFYAKHGFEEVQAEELGPKHADRLRAEKEEFGLEKEGWRRACMVRWI